MPSSIILFLRRIANLGLLPLRNKPQTPELKESPEHFTLSSTPIGRGWATNTINTPIFRHHGLLSLNGYQFTAYYADKSTLRIIKRCLATNLIESHDILGTYDLDDAHNSISLGHDRANHIHITYDHHASALKYRRTREPLCIKNWELDREMTGLHEAMVTYPTFILPRQSFPLTFLYRDGSWNKGKARLKYFDEETNSWSDKDTPILSGADESPWTCNAYWNHPAIGDNGSLHLSYVWRTHSVGHDNLINNINICYAYTLDNGDTWNTSRNRQYQLPITPVNTEVIHPVSPATNLINQCGMALDNSNNPHIVYYANDDFGILQYQHLWFDGTSWRHQLISTRSSPYNLSGKGTLRTPISRPDIVIDKNNNAHVIFRGDFTDNRMALLTLKHPDYRVTAENFYIIDEEMLGYTEPVIDRTKWHDTGILSIFIQYCDQPDHDNLSSGKQSNIRIIDLQIRA